MDRLACAVFEDKPSATAAIDALVNGRVGEEVVNVALHEGDVTREDLSLAAGRSGLRTVERVAIGAVIGGLLGAVLGSVLAPAEMLVSALLASALGGSVVGVIYGILVAAITRRDSAQPLLEDPLPLFAAGKVLVTLDVRGRPSIRDEAWKILSQFGGRKLG